MKNKSVLVIAHRLSTIQNADWIVVMDRNVPGGVVEQGTHDQLLNNRSAYYRLYQQALGSSMIP
jgi:ABC-type multidrug transport system fused ATPase/permease subunit